MGEFLIIMDRPFDEARRESFRKLLIELAQSQSILNSDDDYKKYYQQFQKLYYSKSSARYRHYYSDIFRILTEIKNDTSLSKGNIAILSENISLLNNRYNSIKNVHDKDIGDSLLKLYDHVSLEVARIQYTDSIFNDLSSDSKINDIDSRLYDSLEMSKELTKNTEKLQKDTDKLRADTDTIKNNLDKAQTDYIAILGIFASVVLAFVGGMAFSTSVLENMKDVSIYRLLIVSFVIGLVFVTVIFLMFYFVGILSNRKINGDGSLKPLSLIYALFISLIIIVYGMWNMGAVESRNTQIMRRSEVVDLESTEVSITSDITDDICVEQQNDAAAE